MTKARLQSSTPFHGATLFLRLVAFAPPPGVTPVLSRGGQAGVSSLEATPARWTTSVAQSPPNAPAPLSQMYASRASRILDGSISGWVRGGFFFRSEPTIPLARSINFYTPSIFN